MEVRWPYPPSTVAFDELIYSSGRCAIPTLPNAPLYCRNLPPPPLALLVSAVTQNPRGPFLYVTSSILHCILCALPVRFPRQHRSTRTLHHRTQEESIFYSLSTTACHALREREEIFMIRMEKRNNHAYCNSECFLQKSYVLSQPPTPRPCVFVYRLVLILSIFTGLLL